jgi:hypothetical protein
MNKKREELEKNKILRDAAYEKLASKDIQLSEFEIKKYKRDLRVSNEMFIGQFKLKETK